MVKTKVNRPLRVRYQIMSAIEQLQPSREAVLAKAVLNAADQMGLNQAQLGAVLGVHRSAISRLKQKPVLDPNSKQGELALLFVRIARALLALTGNDKDWAKHFMSTYNKVTRGVPIEQMATITGLITVLNFVDAMRGKI